MPLIPKKTLKRKNDQLFKISESDPKSGSIFEWNWDKGDYSPPKVTHRRKKISGFINAQNFLNRHVVECIFKRKHGMPFHRTIGHKKETRRMLCTSNWDLLNEPYFRKIINFNPPKNPGLRTTQWYKKRGIIIVWDLLMMDWRMITIKEWELKAYMRFDNVNDLTSFTAFYEALIGNGSRKKLSQMKRNKFSDIS